MELFAKVAHEHGTGVIVVTHDHRALDVFDTIYEMEDGIIRRGASKPLTPSERASPNPAIFPCRHPHSLDDLATLAAGSHLNRAHDCGWPQPVG